ncbi:MAG: cation:proton antiporter [Candidatus Aenigmarchaeota archaeon]|nr:cation:proton antiporter [Candidatus Aenigmarchaeota archaeon]
MSVVLTFALASLILVLGFIGNYLFKKTSIPDILILVALGIVLGPLFGIIDPDVLLPISELFSALALLIILFDAGLNLDIKKVLKDSPKATVLTLLSFFVSVIFVSAFTYFVLRWDVLNGLLLGAVLGGISSSVVIPLISRLKISDKVSTVLSLESAFTDALVIVFGLTILQLLVSPLSNGIYGVGNQIAAAFSIAVVIGLVAGVLWLKVLKLLKKEIYDDILTLAIVLLLYSVTEMLGGNGAIFALTFGLVLGNGIRILRVIGIKERIEASKVMKKFHSQMSFFIRTFFFVFIGLIFAVNTTQPVIYGLVITLILFVGRYVAVTLVSYKDKALENNKLTMSIVLGRGLAAAVLAEVIRSSNIIGASLISDTIIVVIISSVIISTLGVSIIGRKLNRCDSELKKVDKKSSKKISSIKN